MSWQALVDAVPELAALKPDGSPRLHPVRPVVTVGRLFVFMEATSPKVRDLEHDPRCALHATATSDQPWDLREFGVEGTARRVEDPEVRSTANVGSAFPRDERFLLYELSIALAFSTTYGSDGRPQRQRWRAT